MDGVVPIVGGKDGRKLIEATFQQIQLMTFMIQQFEFAIEMIIEKGSCFDVSPKLP